MSSRRPFDKAHKKLFKHKRLVKDLLLGFYPEPWVKDLDFDTLRPDSTEYVDKHLRGRSNDVVWRVNLNNEDILIDLIIEGQSSIERFMAVRIGAYAHLHWLDLIARDDAVTQSGKLPPILPIVISVASRPWKMPNSVHELIDDRTPKSLKLLQPNAKFWILNDLFCKIEDEQLKSENTMAQIILTEQATTDTEVIEAAERLDHLLVHDDPQDRSLQEAYFEYLTYVLEKDATRPIKKITSIEEVREMAIGAKAWAEEAERAGMAKGEVKGEAKGIAEANRKIAIRLLERGMDIEEISEITDMTVAEVKALREQNNH